ncbi:protein monoglycylase TTLL8-like [Discoglossus pictus]
MKNSHLLRTSDILQQEIFLNGLSKKAIIMHCKIRSQEERCIARMESLSFTHGILFSFTDLIDTACRICEHYLRELEHLDIDTGLGAPPLLSNKKWSEFIEQYYQLINGCAIAVITEEDIQRCQIVLGKMRAVISQMSIDGIKNVWIIKPAAKSRGRDILCMDKLEDILNFVQRDSITAKDKWIVQKYIETPLLIYSTKFDIRQWFLVTDWNPLTIWFYKDCYLRFSTQHFTLDSLDSSVHLCNNTIQKHLKNCSDRNSRLPHHNMWESSKFCEYLKRKGSKDVWDGMIYPSMKKAIIYTMKMAQDNVEPRKNSFELYGADFIIQEDFTPWLIEINSSPTMFPSTSVTSRLCAQVQEDTIKVVIDRKCDKNCETGGFELIWQQPFVELPPISAVNLKVVGSNIKKAKIQSLVANFMVGPQPPLLPVKPPAGYQEKVKQDFNLNMTPKQSMLKAKDKLSMSSIQASPKFLPGKISRPKSITETNKTSHANLPIFKREQFQDKTPVKHIPILSKMSYYKYFNANATRMDTTCSPYSQSLDWTVLPPTKLPAFAVYYSQEDQDLFPVLKMTPSNREAANRSMLLPFGHSLLGPWTGLCAPAATFITNTGYCTYPRTSSFLSCSINSPQTLTPTSKVEEELDL